MAKRPRYNKGMTTTMPPLPKCLNVGVSSIDGEFRYLETLATASFGSVDVAVNSIDRSLRRRGWQMGPGTAWHRGDRAMDIVANLFLEGQRTAYSVFLRTTPRFDRIYEVDATIRFCKSTDAMEAWEPDEWVAAQKLWPQLLYKLNAKTGEQQDDSVPF